MNTNIYNEKLSELIKEAINDGYKYEKGSFIKEEEDKIVPVMEFFFIDNSVYEDYGRWYIHKRTVKISDEDYDKLMEEFKPYTTYDYEIRLSSSDDFVDNILIPIVCKYDKSECDYININVGGNIFVYRDKNYNRNYPDEIDYIDMRFYKKEDDDDFPRGYVSIYKMKEIDIARQQKLDLKIEKFLHDN